MHAAGIGLGRDGCLWITDEQNPYIWRVTTSGVITQYFYTAGPVYGAAGGPIQHPNGSMYIPEEGIVCILDLQQIYNANLNADVPGSTLSASTVTIAPIYSAHYLANATSNSVAITVPAASPITEGAKLTFVRTDSALGNSITITNTVNGLGTYLATQYSTLIIESINSQWYRIQ
jgi:hypothetical protein